MLLVCLVAGAGCKGSPITTSTASLLVSGPAAQVTQTAKDAQVTIDFGLVPVTGSSSITLTLASDGVPVRVQSVDPTQPDAEFTLPITVGTQVSTSAPATVVVTFLPTSAGDKQAVYTVGTDSQVTPTVTLTLKGTGVPFALALSPNPLDFGNVLLHQIPTLTLTITNTSAEPQPLFIGPVVAGAMSANPGNLFTLGTPSAAVVAPNGTATAQVTYAPVVGENPPQPDVASATIANCSTCQGLSLSLRGVALEAALTVVPDPLDFGFLPLGQSDHKSLLVTNASTAPVKVLGVTFDGGSFVPSPFALSNSGQPSYPVTLAPDAGLSIPFDFGPSQVGEFNGVVVVQSNDPLTPQGIPVPLIGYGGGAQIACVPMSLPFGPVAVGTTSTLNVVCSNVGTDVPGHPEAALVLSAPQIQGDSTFTVVGVSDAGLASGQSAFLKVSYLPTAAQANRAMLTVVSNAVQSAPPVIALSGIGVSPSPCNVAVTPSQLSFGEVPKGQSATESFAIENLSQSYCLVQNLALGSGTDPAFTLVNGPAADQLLSFPGDPNNSAGVAPVKWEIPVAYAPTAAAAASGSVTFTLAQTAAGARSVPLSASSAPACLTLTPDPVDFGLVGYDAPDRVACSYAQRAVSVANICSTSQSVTAVTVTPDPAGGTTPFAVNLPPLPVIVSPGQSTRFQVDYTPNALGEATGTVEVTSTGMTSPYTLALQGQAAGSGHRTETFTTPSLAADVLIVMDTSYGQSQLLDQAGTGPLQQLVAYANAANLDYHFALTSSATCGSGDDGNLEPCAQCLVQTNQNTAIIVTPTSQPDPATLLNDLWLAMLSNVAGTNPCTLFGTALDAADLALQPALLAGQNAGFLRKDAQLLVLIIDGYNFGLSSNASADVDYLRQLKPLGEASLLYVAPQGNGGQGGAASVASAIEELGKGAAIDGTAYASWPAALLQQFSEQLGSGVFPLASAPANGTLQVSVAGLPVPQLGSKGPNWVYDSMAHQIVFQVGSLPQPGQSVVVTYEIACGPAADGGFDGGGTDAGFCSQPGNLPVFSPCVLNADCACGLQCAADTINGTQGEFCERPCVVGDAGCPAYESCNQTTSTCTALCNPTITSTEFQPCGGPGDCSCPLECTMDPVQQTMLCERACTVSTDCIGVNEFCNPDGGQFCQRADRCDPIGGNPEYYEGCVANADCSCPDVCVNDNLLDPLAPNGNEVCEKPCKSQADCTGPYEICNASMGVCQPIDHCTLPIFFATGNVFSPCKDNVPGGQCACGLNCVIDANLSKLDGGEAFCEFCDGGPCQTPAGACQLPDSGLPPPKTIFSSSCLSDVDCECPDTCVFDPGLGRAECRPKCKTNADCPDPTTICNMESGYCNFRPCNTDPQAGPVVHCGGGTCVIGACFAPGTATATCDPEATRQTPSLLCRQGFQCVAQPDGGGLCEKPCDYGQNPGIGCAAGQTCHGSHAPNPYSDSLFSCYPTAGSGCSTGLPASDSPGERGSCNVDSDCACPERCIGTDNQGNSICSAPCTANTDCPDPLTACVGNVCSLTSCPTIGSYCQVGGVDGTCVPLDQFGGQQILTNRSGVCERGGTATTTCSLTPNGTQPPTFCTQGTDCFPLDAGPSCLKVCGYDGGCLPGQQCGWVDNWRLDPEEVCFTPGAGGCDPNHPSNELENCNGVNDCACGLDCVPTAINQVGVYGTSLFCEKPCTTNADCSNIEICDGRPASRHCIPVSCSGSASGPANFTNYGAIGAVCNLDGIGDGTCLDVLPTGDGIPPGANVQFNPPYCVKGGTATVACDPTATRSNPAMLCVPGSECIDSGGTYTCTPTCVSYYNRPDGTNPGCAANQSCELVSQAPGARTAVCTPAQGAP